MLYVILMGSLFMSLLLRALTDATSCYALRKVQQAALTGLSLLLSNGQSCLMLLFQLFERIIRNSFE